MQVYGKANRTCDPRGLLAEVANFLADAARAPRGIRRHAALVTALIEAGALLQGLADADFSDHGSDASSPDQEAATALLLAIAGAVEASWASGFRTEPPDLAEAIAALAARPLPERIGVRWAEGFAYYALYPEAYAVAARRSGLGPDTQVLGLRSIGAPLGAMVCAGLGGRHLRTVRPVGHPFARRLALSAESEASLRVAPAVAVVDEGPGLSGSSLGGTLDALCDLGLPETRVTLFPSHKGAPGPQASEAHRARWSRLEFHVVPFEALVLDPERPEHALTAWVADLTGAADAPLTDISGGRWRRHLYADAAAWPPVNAWQERRKFLLRTRSAIWKLKFAGLGAPAARNAERARILGEAGFGPRVLGVRHGFLVKRWHGDAVPLTADRGENASLIARIGRYLAFRAEVFPAGDEAGAAPAELFEMARHNAGEALGPAWVPALDVHAGAIASLTAAIRPVVSDNRMQPWKWLALPDGALLKTDAVDHHAGHDLIGCQDIAWDIVGAVQEFGFTPDAQADLAGIVAGATGRPIDPRLLAFLTPCYLAFQVGALTLALGATSDPAEGERLRRWLARHTARLRLALSEPGC